MGFSKFRQHLAWSSRDSRAELAQPKENCFRMELSSPARTRMEDRASKVDVTARVNAVQSQGSAIQAHHNPKKLQRSLSSQPVNSLPTPIFSNPFMYADCQQTLPSPPVFEPALIPVRVPPQQYPSPEQDPPRMLLREPPTAVMEEVKRWPKYPLHVPLMPSPFAISQGDIMPPWTANHPALVAWDTKGSSVVPTHELPPSDLIDYDMSFLIAFRMLPEWTKRMEDRHWEQVRRMRNEYHEAQ